VGGCGPVAESLPTREWGSVLSFCSLVILQFEGSAP
jgi:hypothetical protein